jgi:hypothetical protein
MDRQFWACVKGDVHALRDQRRDVGRRAMATNPRGKRSSKHVGCFASASWSVASLYNAAVSAYRLGFHGKLHTYTLCTTPWGNMLRSSSSKKSRPHRGLMDPSKKAVFETVINGAAANAIGLKLAPALLKNADLIID